MYIVVIICLNTGQNDHLFSFPASQHREVREISILAPSNINKAGTEDSTRFLPAATSDSP